MIEDQEMAALFEVECDEHLQTLDDGLLRLETHPFDAATLEEVFRAAHTVKGSARMLGALDVEAVAHRFEDILGAARHDPNTLPSALDRLGRSVEAMRRLVREAVSGEPSGVETYDVIAQLNGPSSNAERTTDFSPPAALHRTWPTLPEHELNEGDAAADEHIFTAFVADMATHNRVEAGTDYLAGGSDASVTDAASSRLPLAEQNSEELTSPPLWGRRITDNVPPLLYEAATEEPHANPNSPLSSLTSAPAAPLGVAPAESKPAVSSPPTPPLPIALQSRASLSNVPPDTSAPSVALPTAADPGAVSASRARSETMRVDPARLDALMTLSGELSVTTTRLTRGLGELDDIASLLEDWSRDVRRTGVPDSAVRLGHIERLSDAVSRLRRVSEEDGARLRAVADEMGESIRRTRLMPMTTVFNPYARMVRDLAREEGREVRLVVEGGETAADKRALEELKDPLMHIVRNAIAHGLETPATREAKGKPRMGTLQLRARRTASEVIVEIEDDGRGLDAEEIQRAALSKGVVTPDELAALAREEIEALIFAPGFSTKTVVNDVSGRGVGLDAAKTNIERLKGSLSVESRLGHGCIFRIRLPVALTTTRVLLARVGQHTYAVPVDWVDTLRLVAPEDVFRVRGRDSFRLGERTVPLAALRDLLELPPEPPPLPRPIARVSGVSQPNEVASPPHAAKLRSCVVLANGEERLGVFVDALLDEQEVVMKPLGGLLERVRNVSGATILGTGEVCMVLNPSDLLKAARRRAGSALSGSSLSNGQGEGAAVKEAGMTQGTGEATKGNASAVAPRKTVLLVEDSITTRTQEKRILESAGYEVTVAVDGMDAWHKLSTRSFDAVVSDVEMPNLDGLGLAARIREETRYAEMPIILVTSLATDEDRQRGMDVGANAYIPKGSFDQRALLDALHRLA